MKCNSCGEYSWELVWGNALIEGNQVLHLWQCKNCKRVVMATEETHEWEESKI